ncbi:LLM class F420-dependent oxidoreductase [soil metagenome]
MSAMKVALMVEPQLGGSYQDLLSLARWAESAGFDGFARSDHYLDHTVSRPVTDAFTSLGGIARETSSIALTVLVTPITFRHPAVIAKSAATLHEMTGGRFELGLGTGWMAGEHEALGLRLPPPAERFSRFEEALAYVSAALGRSNGPVAGDHYRLTDLDLYPRPGAQVRMIIGGSGERRTPALAGRHADEYNLFTVDPDTVRHRTAAMRRAADAIGRDPDAVTMSALVTPIVGADRADYEHRLAETVARRGIDRSALVDRLHHRGIPHGPVDRVAEEFAAIASLGIGRVYLQQFDPLAAIDLDNAALAAKAIRST